MVHQSDQQPERVTSTRLCLAAQPLGSAPAAPQIPPRSSLRAKLSGEDLPFPSFPSSAVPSLVSRLIDSQLVSSIGDYLHLFRKRIEDLRDKRRSIHPPPPFYHSPDDPCVKYFKLHGFLPHKSAVNHAICPPDLAIREIVDLEDLKRKILVTMRREWWHFASAIDFGWNEYMLMLDSFAEYGRRVNSAGDPIIVCFFRPLKFPIEPNYWPREKGPPTDDAHRATEARLPRVCGCDESLKASVRPRCDAVVRDIRVCVRTPLDDGVMRRRVKIGSTRLEELLGYG
ncbi:unnamed protein product [Vitrella brassicaformis CCMP3155]|uniref:Uncharacterized protein n=1 Tax=Vitrella brassicaformis (strain CCMP3155) TaxID=1169540 RepID=A0A0G4FN15_VITBC|nr:unnamed protein product [Vitrella brassicaformis CCMP3155]|eukprot:CEM14971.1 unnamed protein product [Vitrella brassicaformis CCMP3155]